MANVYKVVITGPVGAGKTSFIKNLSEIPAVNTDVKSSINIGKDMTTVALDYGLIHLGDDEIHLFGTPGQDRFSFMWDILSEGAIGFIMLVDSTNPSTFPLARKILDHVLSKFPIPYMVGVTKKDIEPSWDVDFIAEYLGVEPERVKPVLATDRNSILDFIVHFFESYLKERR